MTKSLKLKVDMRECPRCRGLHAYWWFTSKVRPPSCEERIRRGK